MLDATIETLTARVHRYTILRDGAPLAFAEALGLWQGDAAFRAMFTGLLCESPFAAYRFETPPITAATVGRQFEFVLLDSPDLAGSAVEHAFAEHFAAAPAATGVVTFPNLGGDAVLVAPCPRGPDELYGHLAAFVRGAPAEQRHALWRAVGAAAVKALSERPVWLSTAGGGVAWLHVRLDAHPKYYRYPPYRRCAA